MEAFYEDKKEQSLFLGKIFGVVALGFIITALVSFGAGALWSNIIGRGQSGANAFAALVSISAILLLVDAIVMRVKMSRGSRGVWPCYILYASLFGIFLSTFVVAGVSLTTFLEAFGIAGLAFGLLFLIGYFSPINLNWIASLAAVFLLGVLFFGLIFGIMALNGVAQEANNVTNFLISVGSFLFMLIVIGADAYNIKRMVRCGCVSENLILSCAVSLYSDFIYILIRILLALLRNNR